LVSKIKYGSGSPIRRARTPEQQVANLNKLLTERREALAKERLKIDAYLDPQWLKNRGNYDYYLFDLNRTIITRQGLNQIWIYTGDIFKPKLKTKAKYYMNELLMYGHMCFNDYKTYPAQVLKDMASNVKTIQKEISLVKKKIDEQQIHKSKKLEIGTKYTFGLGSGLPKSFHLHLWEELDIMKREFNELEQIIKADQKVKKNKTKTNFLARIQYYIFLCKEIFKMVDFTKYPEINSDNYERYQHGFILRILEEIPEISHTNQVKILNSIKLRPADKKKYEVNQFVNLMGCNSPKEYERARKLINF